MRTKALIARRGQPDRDGVVWDDEKLVEQLHDYIDRGGIVTRNFNPNDPIGKMTGVWVRGEGVYVEIELAEDVAAPAVRGNTASGDYSIQGVSLLPWEKSLLEPEG